MIEQAPGQFQLLPTVLGYAQVMTGVLRAMADDYGALVIPDITGKQDGSDVISITPTNSAKGGL